EEFATQTRDLSRIRLAYKLDHPAVPESQRLVQYPQLIPAARRTIFPLEGRGFGSLALIGLRSIHIKANQAHRQSAIKTEVYGRLSIRYRPERLESSVRPSAVLGVIFVNKIVQRQAVIPRFPVRQIGVSQRQTRDHWRLKCRWKQGGRRHSPFNESLWNGLRQNQLVGILKTINYPRLLDIPLNQDDDLARTVALIGIHCDGLVFYFRYR